MGGGVAELEDEFEELAGKDWFRAFETPGAGSFFDAAGHGPRAGFFRDAQVASPLATPLGWFDGRDIVVVEVEEVEEARDDDELER